MKILDKLHEEALKVILSKKNDSYKLVIYTYDFPEYIEKKVESVLKELENKDYIAQFEIYIDASCHIFLTPLALTYFEDKEKYEQEQKSAKDAHSTNINIQSLSSQGGVIAFGDIVDSTINIDNSINKIEKMIEEKGGEDKQELHGLLKQAKEIIENIEASKHIPKNVGFFNKLSAHMSKHGWFYGAIIQLLGSAALNIIQGKC